GPVHSGAPAPAIVLVYSLTQRSYTKNVLCQRGRIFIWFGRLSDIFRLRGPCVCMYSVDKAGIHQQFVN
ncbi:MAG: hypothetical protein AN484_28440, partial [Aphanizomenon flos-aquae WA102]